LLKRRIELKMTAPARESPRMSAPDKTERLAMKRARWGLFIVGMLALFAAACGEKKTVIEAPPHAVVANELAALARLRSIASAEMLYHAQSGGGFAPLEELTQKGFVNDPAKGSLTGYKFEVKTAGENFQVLATPEKYGITGKRSFYIDTQNVMRGADKQGAAASASDPIV
jgi:hypothetical protein